MQVVIRDIIIIFQNSNKFKKQKKTIKKYLFIYLFINTNQIIQKATNQNSNLQNLFAYAAEVHPLIHRLLRFSLHNLQGIDNFTPYAYIVIFKRP